MSLLVFVTCRQTSQNNAPVAQLDRASVCGTEGRTFESCRVRQSYQRITALLRLVKLYNCVTFMQKSSVPLWLCQSELA